MKSKIQYLHTLPQTIQIPSNESWTLLDTANNDTEQVIVLAEWARLDLYSARTGGKLGLQIIHRGVNSISQIRCGFHAFPPLLRRRGVGGEAKNGEFTEKWTDMVENGKIEAVIKSSFEASHASSEIHILSLAETGGEVLLDSAIDIGEGTKHIVGRLQERHIFLGSGGKIRGIPALVVHSDDIEASHALAIDRISDEELFYLRSRGFSRDDATGLLLDGAISGIFAWLEKVDEKVYTECKKSILGM